MAKFNTTTVTKDTLSARLGEFRSSGRKAMREAQQFIVYGLGVYAKSGNADVILRIYKACTKDNGMDKKLMLGFIKAHANVKLMNEGLKNAKFVKSGKNAPLVKPIESWWFDSEPSETQPAPPMNVGKAFDSLIKRITRELEAKHVDNPKQAEQAIAYLKACQVFNTEDNTSPIELVKRELAA